MVQDVEELQLPAIWRLNTRAIRRYTVTRKERTGSILHDPDRLDVLSSVFVKGWQRQEGVYVSVI